MNESEEGEQPPLNCSTNGTSILVLNSIILFFDINS